MFCGKGPDSTLLLPTYAFCLLHTHSHPHCSTLSPYRFNKADLEMSTQLGTQLVTMLSQI